MTEAEWLACACPDDLLRHLEGIEARRRRQRWPDHLAEEMLRRLRRAGPRWGLFGCACCRRIPHLRELLLRALDDADRDGPRRFSPPHWLARDEEYNPLNAMHGDVCYLSGDDPADEAVLSLLDATFESIRDCAAAAARAVVQRTWVTASEDDTAWLTERAAQAGLLRCLFGNPFRLVVLDAVWQTSTVVSLAQAAYEERILPSGHLDADRLAVLADALEDAGCSDAEILSHLRGPSGPHVRGCWALDILLDKR
jgi:hypothetical protein